MLFLRLQEAVFVRNQEPGGTFWKGKLLAVECQHGQ